MKFRLFGKKKSGASMSSDKIDLVLKSMPISRVMEYPRIKSTKCKACHCVYSSTYKDLSVPSAKDGWVSLSTLPNVTTHCPICNWVNKAEFED